MFTKENSKSSVHYLQIDVWRFNMVGINILFPTNCFILRPLTEQLYLQVEAPSLLRNGAYYKYM